MKIQKTVIVQDLYVLTMEGGNVVLSVQWLETLGSVLTDYKQLTIQFEDQGSSVKFQGIPHLVDSAISNSGLGRMMARKELAYFFHLSCDPPPLPFEIRPEIDFVLKQFQTIFDNPE